VAIDFDTEDRILPVEFIARAKHYMLPAYLERSKSKGYHVWIFFDPNGVNAKKARTVAASILEELEIIDSEIFPKQNSLGPSVPYGNFINAPLFGRLVPSGKTVFLDPTAFEPYRDQWEFLESVEQTNETTLDELIELNEWACSQTENHHTKSSPPKNSSVEFGLPPCAKAMLIRGVEQEQRVSCFRLAVHFKRLGLPYDVTVAALKVWSLKNRPHQGRRIITEPEIIEQTQYAYTHEYKGYGCESSAVMPFCQKKCPLLSKKNASPSSH
jgi:hypothetical protein